MNHKKLNFIQQKGLTLVELLVASALGLLLVGIIGSMYVTSVTGFRSANELSKVQENTRFALNFIQKSLRSGGYSQCGFGLTRDYSFLKDNYHSTVGSGLFGWEYDGSDSGDTLTLTYTDLDEDSSTTEITNARTANTGTLTSWLAIANAPELDDFVANYSPMAGSDIIAVTTEVERNDITVDELNAAADSLLVSGTGASGADALPQGAIIKVGNCFERNIFAKSNTASISGVIEAIGDGSTEPNIAFSERHFPGEAFSKPWGVYDERGLGTADDQEHIAKVYQDITTFFFVGTGASGLPSLFRLVSECGFLFDDCEESGLVLTELVEGVENLQVLYGVDMDTVRDGVADQFYSADEVPVVLDAINIVEDYGTNFADVVSLRLSVLMRSNQRSEPTDQTNYLLADTITVNPVDKGILRYVTNLTVELRNRED